MRVNRRSLLALTATGLVTAGWESSAQAQTPLPTSKAPMPPPIADPAETIDLWPQGVPGMPGNLPQEAITQRSTDPTYSDRIIQGVTRPRMTVFRPVKPNGGAVMITPGGGYRWVVIDKEGFEMARWLVARGYTVFVLFYRLPGDGWASGADVVLQDTQRAMRLIRHRADTYGIDPARVAAMGFSAGGHACADLAARYDEQVYTPIDAADSLSARPFIAAPIYPVISMSLPSAHAGSREKLIGKDATPRQEAAHSPHLHVPDKAPPHFLLHAYDDAAVPVENTLLLEKALRAKKIPIEMHLFTQGGHGFGLRLAKGKPVEVWPDLFLRWAKTMGF